MRQSQHNTKTPQSIINIPLCTHIKKLTKSQITSIYQTPCQFTCAFHNFSSITNLSICLHCNKSFCDINSIQKCILTHQTMNNNQHIFSLNLQSNSEVYCNLCKQSINYIIKCYENTQIKENDDFKKLKRFMEFIRQAQTKVKIIYEQSLKSINIPHDNFNYKGLLNIGNTCFLNCVLQVLNYSKPFTQLYQSYKITGGFSKSILSIKKLLNKQMQYFYDEIIQQNQGKIWHVVTNKKQKKNEQNQKFIKSITNCKLNEIIINFFKQMKMQEKDNNNQNQGKTHSAIQILEYIAHIDKKYTYKQQQDAEQALLFIIDILVQGQFIAMGYDQEKYRKVQQFIGRQKITPLQKIFGTYLVSQIYCQNCKKISYTFDLTYHISIDLTTQKIAQLKSIRQHFSSSQLLNKQKLYYKWLDYPQVNMQQQQISLPSFLHSFFSTQRLTLKQNFYSCSQCKSLVGYKKFYLVSTPQILIISIKRFNHKMIKNNKHVAFDDKINLKDITMKEESNQNQGNQQCQYQLYGVIVHIGQNINSGHYVCYVKTQDNVWIRCSDTNIRKVKFNQVKQQQAYILSYQKIK